MSLSRNAFYNSAAGLIRIALTIVTMPLLIRLLGVKDYGLWTLVSAFIEVIVFAGNGISVTSTVFVAKNTTPIGFNKELSETLLVLLGGVILTASVAAISVLCGSKYVIPAFSLDVSQTNVMITSLNFGAFIIWTRLIQHVLIGIEQAFQKYGGLNFLNTIQYLLLNLGFLVIVKYGGSILELMQWQAMTYLSILISHACFVKNIFSGIEFSISWNRQKFIEIVRHSLIMLALCLGGVVFNKGDRIVVAYYLSPALLGIYSGITEIASAIINFSSLPVQPIVPLLSSHVFGDKPDENLKYQIKQVLEISSIISVLCGSWLFALAPIIAKFLFAEESNASVIISLRIAIVIYTFISIYSVGFHTLLSLSVGSAATIYLISSVLSLCLISYGAVSIGLSGAIIGNVGFMLCWLMLFIAMKKLSFPHLFWARCIAIPLSLFITTIVTIYVFQLDVLSSIVIDLFSTLIMIIWFVIMQKERILNIVKKYKRIG